MKLYHYFDPTGEPFRNLSELSRDAANEVLESIRRDKPDSQCAARQIDYWDARQHFEGILRTEFAKKGGRIERTVPHYLVLEHSPWLSSWFSPSAHISIPVEEFDLRTVSFTYGDSHPTFSPRVTDGKPYRRQVYTYAEILRVIDQFGLPQDWNDDGRFGPERYIEACVWSDQPIQRYRQAWIKEHTHD